MYIYIFNEKGNTVNRHLKRIAAALLCCVITTSAAGCFEKDGKDGIIKYDIAYNPGSLDPQTASDDASILIINSVYTGLMRVLPDGSLGTGAAEDYTVTDDGLTSTNSRPPAPPRISYTDSSGFSTRRPALRGLPSTSA